MQNGSLRGPREEALPNTILDDPGRTALHEAVFNGDEKSLQVLLAGGVDRNAKDHKHGNTPLHEAAWRGFSRCVKALCSLPQPKTSKDVKETKLKGVLQDTRGALHSALLGTRNTGGFSALHLAAQNGHNQSCREILLAGADPDVQNNYGDTPLHTACRYGHAGATRILISAKCDPNRTNLNGDSPLHISCAMGRRKLTRILLEAGSSIDIKNAQSESPRDIAVRKQLTEILEILDNPVPASRAKSRDRSSSNSKNADKVDSGKPATTKKKSDCVAEHADHTKWSPYGCHYFPDPRSFPSPKLETLPKEPLAKGEQYYLDLAGNIRKGPIGVGNTCYCGPFFRHIEERISRNRKSIRKYVHKATERLDNKVQALALRTDDQIEQLTRSMIADRIRCEGRRLHLEQWLMRGDPGRATVAHHPKSKKNMDNTNTLTRCRSLELLDSNEIPDPKMQNSKSFDMLDDSGGEEDFTVSRPEKPPSRLSSDRKASKHSDQSRSSSNRLEGERYSVSRRLEELLAKTNEILEMEKKSRVRVKDNLPTHRSKQKSGPDKVKLKRHSLYDDETMSQMNSTVLSNGDPPLPRILKDSEFITHEMERIAISLAAPNDSKNENQPPPMSPEIAKDFASQKELERKSDLEHEKSSIVSGSSHKDPSITGSDYIPDFSRIRAVRSRSNSAEVSNKSMDSAESFLSPTELILDSQHLSVDHKFKSLLSALRRDYNSTKKAIAAEIARESSGAEMNLDDPNANYENMTEFVDNPMTINGFYENTCFEDAVSSSNNTLRSERQKAGTDQDEAADLTELANVNEINELKSRILNGSNWRSQVLRRSQQQLVHPPHDDHAAKGINGVVRKLEIKNSEIKTLKSPTSGILRRSKVQELVAKIEAEVPDHKDEQSESSEDEVDGQVPYSDHSIRAQPQQVAGIYQDRSNMSPNIAIQDATRIVDPRNLIPKDAYFHEIPNRNRLYPMQEKINEKSMIGVSNQIQSSSTTMAARTRNPLPYIPEVTYVNKLPHPESQQQRHPQFQEKLLSSRKFTFSNAVDNELSRIHMNQQPQQLSPHTMTHQTILLTAEQAQIDRDMNNDSGYSTKMCGSSHGPSPSLSGHTELGVLDPGGLPNSYQHADGSAVTYFIGNVGASSLV